MKWKLPPNVHGYINRHGKAVFYYRIPGSPKVRLRGHPGSDEFMLAYDLAKAGERPKVELGAGRTKPGTVNAAVVSYYQSPSGRTCRKFAEDAPRHPRKIPARLTVKNAWP